MSLVARSGMSPLQDVVFGWATSALLPSCVDTQAHTHRKRKTKEPASKQRDNNSIHREMELAFSSPIWKPYLDKAQWMAFGGRGCLFQARHFFANCLFCAAFCLQFLLIFSRLLLWKTHTIQAQDAVSTTGGKKKNALGNIFFNILNYYCTEKIVQSS